ncbi:ankyrin repeat domain-containing protein 13B-like isoform X2 [Halichondria panicea]|uniref:ankyrin repeat domain-containing protein 13B-like isoform X2 n=1 Tax=Halichondria panicea TaxID=6063 RepID=UPI00312B9F1F
MAMNTPHFAKVKDFINLQMPSGFPVRFEIPLMSAKVTFGNVNSHSEPVPHVSLRTEERREDPVPVYTPTGPISLATTEGGLVKQRHERAAGGSSVDPEDTTPADSAVDMGSSTVQTQEVCTISEECFQVPPTYRRLNTGSYSMANEEEELLQLAIRQSLLEQGEGDPEEQLSLREALGD